MRRSKAFVLTSFRPRLQILNLRVLCNPILTFKTRSRCTGLEEGPLPSSLFDHKLPRIGLPGDPFLTFSPESFSGLGLLGHFSALSPGNPAFHSLGDPGSAGPSAPLRTPLCTAAAPMLGLIEKQEKFHRKDCFLNNYFVKGLWPKLLGGIFSGGCSSAWVCVCVCDNPSPTPTPLPRVSSPIPTSQPPPPNAL